MADPAHLSSASDRQRMRNGEWRNTPALCPLLLCEFSFACCDTAAHPYFARLDLCAILSSVGPEVSVMG